MLETIEQVTKILSWREMPRNIVCKFYRVDDVGKFLREWPGGELAVVYYNAATKVLYVPMGAVLVQVLDDSD